MKKSFKLLICGAIVGATLAPSAFAQVQGDEYDDSTLYLPNVNLTSLNQNGFTGIVGGEFYTPYYFNVDVNYVGYADPTDAALAISHTVTVWDNNGNVAATAVVPAGTPSVYENGYAWVALPSTVTLSYQSYYYVGATVTGGVDPWGDLIVNSAPDNGNNGQITWNTQGGISSVSAPNGPFVQGSPGYEFSRVGIYDGNTSDAGNPLPLSDLGYTSAQDSIYSAANLGYNIIGTVVPEPSTLSLAGVGAAMLFGRILKRTKAS